MILRCAFLAIATVLPLLAAASAAVGETAYVRTDLVSNTQNLVQPIDPNLQNAWGVANSPGGPLWVSDSNDGLSTLYDGRVLALEQREHADKPKACDLGQ